MKWKKYRKSGISRDFFVAFRGLSSALDLTLLALIDKIGWTTWILGQKPESEFAGIYEHWETENLEFWGSLTAWYQSYTWASKLDMRIFTMLHECRINASQNAAISLFEQLLLYGLITACSRFERTVIAARYLCCMRCSDVRCLYEQGMVCQELKTGKRLHYKTYFLTWSTLFFR